MTDVLTDWSLSFERQIAMRCWPDFAHGSFLLDILQIADDSADVGDRPHSIAAILLYQQLAEELLFAVDYWCYYEQALAIYPTHFEYVLPDRIMFGQLLKRITESQAFLNKDLVLRVSRHINEKCRIPVAHRLLFDRTFSQLDILAREARSSFHELVDSMHEIQYHFWRRFERLADRTGIRDERQEAQPGGAAAGDQPAD